MNNTITIIGHVGQNPKETNFPSGKQVVNFSVAVKEYGTAQEESQPIWFDVQAWNGLGDSVLSNLAKGREILVQGRLTLNTYKKADHWIVKPVIILGGYHACGKKQCTNSADSKIKLKATA